MNYDLLDLRGLALEIISKYTETPKSQLRNSMSLWDDLTLEDHDMNMIVMDILEKADSPLDINDDSLIELLETDTIKEFLHILYTIDL